MNICNCLDPVIIVNPQLQQRAVAFDKIVVDGSMRTIRSDERFDIMSGERASTVLRVPYAKSLTADFTNKLNDQDRRSVYRRFRYFVDDSFLLNSDTGEILPLYQFVPCGHCDYCNSLKLASYVQRATFAVQESACVPYFITFTFNDQHLCDAVAAKELFQKFKKRFKKQLDKFVKDPFVKSLPNIIYCPEEVKFICVSEYGKKGRLHLHCIVFGIPNMFPSSVTQDYYVTQLFEYCWREPEHLSGIFFRQFKDYCYLYPKIRNLTFDYDLYSYGFVNVHEISSGDGSSVSAAVVNYVLKYLFKDLTGWRSVSVNLGVEFANSLRPYIVASSDGSFEFRDFLSGKTVKSYLSGYFIKKLFPSESDLIPCEFRRCFYDVNYYCEHLSALDWVPKEAKKSLLSIRTVVQRDFNFLNVLHVSNTYEPHFLKSYDFTVDELRTNYLVECFFDLNTLLQRLYSYRIDYNSLLSQLKERADFFLKLDLEKSEGQLIDVARNYIRENKSLISKSVLN